HRSPARAARAQRALARLEGAPRQRTRRKSADHPPPIADERLRRAVGLSQMSDHRFSIFQAAKPLVCWKLLGQSPNRLGHLAPFKQTANREGKLLLAAQTRFEVSQARRAFGLNQGEQPMV